MFIVRPSNADHTDDKMLLLFYLLFFLVSYCFTSCSPKTTQNGQKKRPNNNEMKEIYIHIWKSTHCTHFTCMYIVQSSLNIASTYSHACEWIEHKTKLARSTHHSLINSNRILVLPYIFPNDVFDFIGFFAEESLFFLYLLHWHDVLVPT